MSEQEQETVAGHPKADKVGGVRVGDKVEIEKVIDTSEAKAQESNSNEEGEVVEKSVDLSEFTTNSDLAEKKFDYQFQQGKQPKHDNTNRNNNKNFNIQQPKK